MKNKLKLLVALALLPLAQVFAYNGNDAYKSGGVAITAAALSGSATTVNPITSAAVVSSTALNISGTDIIASITCDQDTSLAIVSGTASAGPISLTSSTGYPLLARLERVIAVPPSSTMAFIANSTTSKCTLQRLRVR